MFSVNLVLRVRSDKGWVRIPVRRTPQVKFIWDNHEHGVYYLEWYEDGKRKRQAVGLRPAEILDARRRKILELKGRAIENGRTIQPGVSEDSPVPLAATVDTYLNHLRINQKLNTYCRYRSVRDNFRQYFASKKYLNEISRGAILEYRDFRATLVASPVTLNSEITMIRAFFYWCVHYKGLRENPAAKIKPRKVVERPPEVYSDKDIAKLLGAADPVEQAVLLTLLYTGLREQELCHLAWDDVDFKKKVLRVTAKPAEKFTPKTWEERDIEMSDRLIQSLNLLPRKARWVFPTVGGKRHAHVYKIVEQVAETAEIQGAHPHKFRATFLTRLLQFGCDIANVQALAGHRNIKTTQRYLGVSTALRREAVNRLDFPEPAPKSEKASKETPSASTPS
jgi:site-specific recombinase XerD